MVMTHQVGIGESKLSNWDINDMKFQGTQMKPDGLKLALLFMLSIDV